MIQYHSMKNIKLLPLFLFLAALGLAACQTADPLPTAAALPTQDIAALPTLSPTEETAPIANKLPPTFTLTPTHTATTTAAFTSTVSVTPSATITDTPTGTATPVPTLNPEERARTSLLMDMFPLLTDLPPGGYIATPLPAMTLFPAGAPGATVGPGTPSVIIIPNQGSVILPTSAAQTPLCSFFPPGGFATVYSNNPDIASVIGCAAGNPPITESIQAAVQPFQLGLMIWLNGTIYVFRATDNTFTIYSDTFTAGVDPETSSEAPPSGFFSPMRGFLKVWSNNPSAHDLGWALQPEAGAQATVQRFERGMMIAIPGRQDIFVLMNGSGSIQTGTWRSVIGQF
jgi:hypothetical protein